MTHTPQFIKEGWRPHGPGRCRCPICHDICSTNALARARHVCKNDKREDAATEKSMTRETTP